MHKVLIWLVVSLVPVWVGSVGAAGMAKVVVHGDVSPPVTPDRFADVTSLGIGGGMGLGLPLTTGFMVLAGVDYTTFSLDEDGFRKRYGLPVGSVLSGGETSALYASVGFRLSVPFFFGGPVSPYLIGGWGYFRIDADDVTSNGTRFDLKSEDSTGFHGGCGLDVSFGSSLSIFLDALLVVGLTDEEATSYVPLRAGIAFDIKPDV